MFSTYPGLNIEKVSYGAMQYTCPERLGRVSSSLDFEVAEQAGKGTLVGVVVFPCGKVSDVPTGRRVGFPPSALQTGRPEALVPGNP